MDDDMLLGADLTDLRSLMPMLQHYVTMLSSPSTSRHHSNATTELAELAELMSSLSAVCEMHDCAEVLRSLAVSTRAISPSRLWSEGLTVAARDAVGYLQARISVRPDDAADLPAVIWFWMPAELEATTTPPNRAQAMIEATAMRLRWRGMGILGRVCVSSARRGSGGRATPQNAVPGHGGAYLTGRHFDGS